MYSLSTSNYSDTQLTHLMNTITFLPNEDWVKQKLWCTEPCPPNLSHISTCNSGTALEQASSWWLNIPEQLSHRVVYTELIHCQFVPENRINCVCKCSLPFFYLLTSFWGCNVIWHTFCKSKMVQETVSTGGGRERGTNTSFICLTISNSDDVLKMKPSLRKRSWRYRVTSRPAISDLMMECGRENPS